MRLFIIKTTIVFFASYILFQITLGNKIDYLSLKVKSLTNQQQRIKIKEKILSEIKKGTEKENFFSEEEKIILSNFLKKIINELNINETK